MKLPPLPPYRVREHARARRVRLRVSPAHGIEVVVPSGFPARELPRLLEPHRHWMEMQLARCRAGLELPAVMLLPALGETWSLRREALPEGRRARLLVEAGALHLQAADAAAARALLQRFVQRRAAEVLPPWLARVAEETGLRFAGVHIRTQRARWGSCSASGRISLNCKLLFLEPALVRHVLVHELCHTVHLNHSPAFWKVVADHDPDWRRLRAELQARPAMAPAWIEA